MKSGLEKVRTIMYPVSYISEDGSSMGHDVMIYCILSVSTLVTMWLCGCVN